MRYLLLLVLLLVSHQCALGGELIGDFDMDCMITLEDSLAMRLGLDFGDPEFDLDGDGSVDPSDWYFQWTANGLPVGDYNYDGHITFVDIDMVVSESAIASPSLAFDLNVNGRVTGSDVNRLLELNDLDRADPDLDGDRDSADRTTMTINWTGAHEGYGFPYTQSYSQGDIDYDGDVDVADLSIFVGRWTGALEVGQDAAEDVSIPEPNSIVLLMIGAIALGRFHRIAVKLPRSSSQSSDC